MSDSPFQNDSSIDALMEAARNGQVARRDFLRRVVVLGLSSSAAYELLNQSKVAAQSPQAGGKPRITTFALGEEGNPPDQQPSPNPPTYPAPKRGGQLTSAVGEEAGRPTTLAVGEEGTGQPTTQAIGEEGGRPTTLAHGEEGSPPPTTYPSGEEQKQYCPTPSPQPTTQAIGEEGRPTPAPTTQAFGEEQSATTRAYGEESPSRPNATTMSLGEEGSPKYPSSSPVLPPSKPQITTRALGEEGNSGNSNRSRSSNLLRSLPRPWKNFRRW